MSIFAFYFAGNLLREAGWPRKLGMFKGEGYDATIVDLAWGQSMDWGAALGAGRPRLALQMIAEIYRGVDWESDDAPDFKVFVERAQEGPLSAAASPQQAVQLPQFAERMSTISLKQFTDPQARSTMDQRLQYALFWGLSYPDRFEAWYASRVADYESQLPLYQRMGLEIDELPSLQQFYEDSEQILRDFERDLAPLPSIPSRLLADAEQLGWRV